MSNNKVLTKEFQDLLRSGDLQKLKLFFSECDVNARDEDHSRTALAFDQCPEEFMRWLVVRGADVDAPDRYGYPPLVWHLTSSTGQPKVLIELGADVNFAAFFGSGETPLHVAACTLNKENVRMLLEHGANPNKSCRSEVTPLEQILRSSVNGNLQEIPAIVDMMLEFGAIKTPSTKEAVEEIGQRFEYERDDTNSISQATDIAALEYLYRLFDVPPAPRRRRHDGVSPICVTTNGWAEQSLELAELLLPLHGVAATVQGELLRLAGRLAFALQIEEGKTWDDKLSSMAEAYLKYLQSGNPLDSLQLEVAKRHLNCIGHTSEDYDAPSIEELAVLWILRNRIPIPMKKQT